MTEYEMVGWHHQLDGHDSEQTLGDKEGQGSLVCRSRGNPACRGTFGGRRKAVRDRLALQGGTGGTRPNHYEILWPPDAKILLIGKDSDTEKA